jgi:hypothetical protein
MNALRLLLVIAVSALSAASAIDGEIADTDTIDKMERDGNVSQPFLQSFHRSFLESCRVNGKA